MTKDKLVFFGTEDFSVPSLTRLIKDGWNIAAVITKPDAPAGRGRLKRTPAVAAKAKKAGLTVGQPEKLSNISALLDDFKPDAGVLVSYGRIIPQDILDMFPNGVINLHPSLLPKYRGPSPIEAAILNGDSQTGVSLMRLSAGMDEGPLYAQKRIEIAPDDDAKSLAKKLAEFGAELLADRLESILKGWSLPKPQFDGDATYTKKLKKEDGAMDFNKSAKQLEREVRAYAGWPKSNAKIHGHDVIVTKARIARDGNDGELVIKCQPGYLEIVELVGPSGKTMLGTDFLRGYKK